LFQECIDADLLAMAVQPIVPSDAPDDVFAVECLLRSRHPVLSGPLSILHAVERAGRVFELGAIANQLAARWAEKLPRDLLIFVNVHPAQFDDPALLRQFEPLLPHASRIVLEITERASLRDFAHWESAVTRLEALGFRFALDDLGSGYGGLSLLADIRPAFIKVDMSIVRNVHLRPQNQRLVDVLAIFANATGARLVAEGVETEDEARTLVRCGAHLMQGFHVARPQLLWPGAAAV
jgi:EAL domain-containing protein (putative c-di-GMP-specific phosphodiesterase class I)